MKKVEKTDRYFFFKDAFLAIERLAGEASPEGDRKRAEKSVFWIFFYTELTESNLPN